MQVAVVPAVLTVVTAIGRTETPVALIASARDAGYTGAMFWSVMAEDDATDFANAHSGLDEWTRAPDNPARA